MLTPWLELPGAADRLATWSEISGLYLAQLGTTATAEEITDTAVTQPLVVAATLLAFEELTKRGLLAGATTIVAGHSVGEIAAYAIAGVISADEAIKLAATRGYGAAEARALAGWIADGAAKQAIFNLKLPMKKRWAELQRCEALIAETLAGSPYRLALKQLYHDREEVTGWLRRG